MSILKAIDAFVIAWQTRMIRINRLSDEQLDRDDYVTNKQINSRL